MTTRKPGLYTQEYVTSGNGKWEEIPEKERVVAVLANGAEIVISMDKGKSLSLWNRNSYNYRIAATSVGACNVIGVVAIDKRGQKERDELRAEVARLNVELGKLSAQALLVRT